MSKKQRQQNEKLESFRTSQAHLSYLRDEIRDAHWACGGHVSSDAHGSKQVPIRTAGGIHFANLGKVD